MQMIDLVFLYNVLFSFCYHRIHGTVMVHFWFSYVLFFLIVLRCLFCLYLLFCFTFFVLFVYGPSSILAKTECFFICCSTYLFSSVMTFSLLYRVQTTESLCAMRCSDVQMGYWSEWVDFLYTVILMLFLLSDECSCPKIIWLD